MNILPALLLAASCFGLMTPVPQEKPMPTRCVAITVDDGSGTGVILQTGLVVTNFHMLSTGSGIQVDGEEADIIHVSPSKDLIFLKVKTEKFAPLKFAEAHVGEMVYYVGNPGGHHCIAVVARVVDIADGRIYVDAGRIFPGASGSALYNRQGELVGIVEAMQLIGDMPAFGIAIPSARVQEELDALPKP